MHHRTANQAKFQSYIRPVRRTSNKKTTSNCARQRRAYSGAGRDTPSRSVVKWPVAEGLKQTATETKASGASLASYPSREDPSWSDLGRRQRLRRRRRMRKAQQGSTRVVRLDQASPASSFRELDDAFLQVSARNTPSSKLFVCLIAPWGLMEQ